MILDNFERQNRDFLWISRANCTEIARDRDSLRIKLSALYVVLTSLKFRPPGFKEFSVRGCQTWAPPSKYSHSATQTAAATRDGGAVWRM